MQVLKKGIAQSINYYAHDPPLYNEPGNKAKAKLESAKASLESAKAKLESAKAKLESVRHFNALYFQKQVSFSSLPYLHSYVQTVVFYSYLNFTIKFIKGMYPYSMAIDMCL